MRIRRRPQQPPSSPRQQQLLHQASDPSTSAAPALTPQNAAWDRVRLEAGGGCKEEEEGTPRADADLGGHQKSGAARRLALPQDNAADCGRGVGAPPQLGAGGDDARTRCNGMNGHRSSGQNKGGVGCNGRKSEPAATEVVKVEEHGRNNGVLLSLAPPTPVAAAVNVKSEGKASNGTGGPKKRRAPAAVLVEGSRCSRVNGRGWRCSQPTPAGYSLCEHHLGKGRMRSAAAAAAAAGGPRGGAGQLGRTEHAAARIPTTAAAPAPQAEGQSLPRC